MNDTELMLLAQLTAAVTLNLPPLTNANDETDHVNVSRIVAYAVCTWAKEAISKYGSVACAFAVYDDTGLPLYEVADVIANDVRARLGVH